GVQDVLCTAKDAVKLRPQAGLNFWILQTGLLFSENGEETLLDVVRHACCGDQYRHGLNF
ncbi:hypothetical protein, partial [Desulfonatronospira sp. MSAO_Bac3]|uniref:hypothetical protein n=1 Tax=Desulfonatronospira sp. MSAO_Bac3 TaxID=2293857 RepID=UPI000FF3E68A